jgi:YidC/Oxa1 family membrane protein insertase
LARKARAFAGAGVAHANLGTDQSLETATGFLKRSIELRNDDVATMLSLAAVLKKTGDLYGALAVLEQASGIAPEIRQRFLAPLQLEIERSKKRDAHKQTKGTRLGGKKEKAFGKEKRR